MLRSSLKTAVARLKTRIGSDARYGGGSIQGFVERVGDGRIEGWVIDTHPPGSFTISFGGEAIPIAAQRLERRDVSAIVPEAPLSSGFSLRIPAVILSENHTPDLSALEVRYAGKRVALSESLRATLASTRAVWRRKVALPSSVEAVAVPVMKKPDTKSIRQYGLSLIVDAEALPDGSAVEIHWHDLRIRAHPRLSQDEKQLLIDLPPFIWDACDPQGSCKLWIVCEEDAVGTVTVHAETAVRALNFLPARPRDDIAEILLGLEHARYLAKGVTFSEPLRKWLAEEAERFDCVDYVFEFCPQSTLAASAVQTPRSTEDQILRDASDHFRHSILAGSPPSADLLDEISARFDLDAVQQHRLIRKFTEDFCRAGRFRDIAFRLHVSELSETACTGDAWATTNAIPFLVAQGALDIAQHSMRRLPTTKGWVSTPCLLEASRSLASDPRPLEQRLPFLRSLIIFLDSLGGDYWSRLYDHDLVATLSPWFRYSHALPDTVFDELVSSALRNLSLSRDFWAQLPEIERDCVQSARLHAAGRAFEALSVLRRAPVSRNGLFAALDAGRFFREVGNKDGGLVVRDVAMHIFAIHADDAELVARAQNELDAIDLSERLRLLAHPCGYKAAYSMSAGETLDLVREVLGRDKSQATGAHYHLQSLIGQKLAFKAAASEFSIDDATEFVALASGLNCAEGGWLAADVLLQASLFAPPGGEIRQTLVAQARAFLSDALRPGIDILSFPPLMTAVARLSGLLHSAQDVADEVCADAVLLEQVRTRSGAAAVSELKATQALLKERPPSLAGYCDTLVVLYSCRKYLDDRIPELRETWISDLKARSIPYVILVGDGDNTLDGDVLRLDVADSYEALPTKTLKMIEWVYQHTDFQYLVKIDDDCYFSAERFFNTLNYRKHHYYGRILARGIGAMKRDWHQEKSKDPVAKARLDRSPEPSRYCDGGSGYSLSRHAMRKALEAARSAAGKNLISVSYMEDKLLGDLLALKAISPSNEDYFVHILRRTHSGAAPVTMYVDHFGPSRASPASLVHLDDAEPLTKFHRMNRTDEVWPRRIWPTLSDVRLFYNGNQLICASATEKLSRVLAAEIVVVAVIRNEIAILPHFLAHYRGLGVSAFLIADNLSDDGSREFLMTQDDVVLYTVDSEYSASHYGVAWQQALISNHCLGKWVVLVDADEFLTYPNALKKSLKDITVDLEANNYDCAGALLIDMYPKGALSSCDLTKGSPFDLAPYHDEPPVRRITGTGVFSNTTFSVTSNLRHRLSPGTDATLFMANKYPLIRYHPLIRLSAGIHYVGNVSIAPEFLTLAHFKYHAGFAEKVDAEIRRKQHFAGAVEYQRYQLMLAETRGELYDDNISRRFSPDRQFVRACRV